MCTSLPMELYYFPPSPPCRAVMLLARAIDAKLELRHVDLMAGEHLAVDFVKLNPQHTIPTFVEGDLILCESRAILGYLVDRHAEDDSLYPQEPKRRARVNARLYFDAGTLHQRLYDYMVPVVFRGQKPSEEQWKKVEEAFGFLDKFLEDDEWVAGDSITIADYSIVVTTSNGEAFGLDLGKFPHVSRWYNKAKESMQDYEELNQAGANQLGNLFRARVAEAENSV
ncbi:hypothetical protein R5R35_005742 [Gryllus longicercus]|uniref:Uncharacterized protein n=1 Tax=Gryllus longicercus TaxID=2509291 RepID=A0AAN9W3V5_9ORTH